MRTAIKIKYEFGNYLIVMRALKIADFKSLL